jgi:glutathione S-transferase
MIKLYHARYTRSLRVRWLLEELGLPYELHRINFGKKEHKEPDYLAVHPLGRLPAMTDGDVAMFESGAMLQWILEKYGEGRLHPLPGSAESATYLQWFHFGEATHQPYLSTIAQHTAILPEEERIPALAEKAAEGAMDCNRMLNAHLSEHEYVAGDHFSAADIMVTYPLILSHLFGILPADGLPHLMAYYERVAARPAFQTATAD